MPGYNLPCVQAARLWGRPIRYRQTGGVGREQIDIRAETDTVWVLCCALCAQETGGRLLVEALVPDFQVRVGVGPGVR